MDFILDIVKERGVVDIINSYKKDLEYADKLKKNINRLNTDFHLRYFYFEVDNFIYSIFIHNDYTVYKDIYIHNGEITTVRKTYFYNKTEACIYISTFPSYYYLRN